MTDLVTSFKRCFIETEYSHSLVRAEYGILLLYLTISIALAIIIFGASYVLVKQNPESEKLSPYECGFEPFDDARHSFDLKFCVIAILFIVFDIEIMFLMPWSVAVSRLDLLGFWSMIDFLLELCVGFFYVWYARALNWQ